MKFFLAVIALTLVAVCRCAVDPREAEFNKLADDCTVSVGATKEIEDKQNIADPKYQDIVVCVGERTEFLSGNGVNTEKMLDNMQVTDPTERAEMVKAVNACLVGQSVDTKEGKAKVTDCSGKAFERIILKKKL